MRNDISFIVVKFINFVVSIFTKSFPSTEGEVSKNDFYKYQVFHAGYQVSFYLWLFGPVLNY